VPAVTLRAALLRMFVRPVMRVRHVPISQPRLPPGGLGQRRAQLQARRSAWPRPTRPRAGQRPSRPRVGYDQGTPPCPKPSTRQRLDDQWT